MDWSGRGQHAEFEGKEKPMLNSILHPEEVIGSSLTAIVESVRCRRILLARKTIRFNRRFTREQAVEEVAHLTKISHSHVIQVIGTYVMGNTLSILLYPVAQWNLTEFLHDINAHDLAQKERFARHNALMSFIPCLTRALTYIHGKLIKHMDIKPRNILIRDTRTSTQRSPFGLKPYIADFGIARSYSTPDAAETDSPTMFTRRYAAPEVVNREKRGFPADVFSLGCVFAEIIDAIPDHENSAVHEADTKLYDKWKSMMGSSAHPDSRLQCVLEMNRDGNHCYYANILEVQLLIRRLLQQTPQAYWLAGRSMLSEMEGVLGMVNEHPGDRPLARSLCLSWHTYTLCCTDGPDRFEATSPNASISEQDET